MTPDAMLDVPPHYRQWRLTDYGPAVTEMVTPFLNGESASLYLHGVVGSRKTSVAAAVLAEWRATGKPGSCTEYGCWVSCSRLAETMRDLENGQYRLRQWRDRPILVLDDLGAIRSTPHVVEQTLHLLGHRYDRKLPTIATSNLSLPSLAVALDERIASRLQEGIVLDLGIRDKRIQEKAND